MIEELTYDHYQSILRLWQVADLPARLKGRDHPESVQNQLKNSNIFFLGYKIDNEIRGVVLVTHDGRKGWINRLAVHPNYRHQGVARKLIKAAESELFIRFGIEIYCTLILDDNDASLSLFEKEGYSYWPQIRYYTKRARDDI